MASFHKNADNSVGEVLASSSRWELRYAAAKSSHISSTTKDKLKNDANKWVKYPATNSKPWFGTGWAHESWLRKDMTAAGLDVKAVEALGIKFGLKD